MIIIPNAVPGAKFLTQPLVTLATLGTPMRVDVAGTKAVVYTSDASYNERIYIVDLINNVILNNTSLGALSGSYATAYGLACNYARPDVFYILFGRYSQNITSYSINANNTVTAGSSFNLYNDQNYTPNDICVSKDGTRLYATRAVNNVNYLQYFNISSGTSLTNMGALQNGGTLSNSYGDSVVVTPDHTKVFVAHCWSNLLEYYSVSNGTPTMAASNMPFSWVGYTKPNGMAMSPTGTEFMAWAQAWARFARFSTSFAYASNTSTAGAKLTTGIHSFCPEDAAYSADGSVIYLTYDGKFYATLASKTSGVYDGSVLADWTMDSATIAGAKNIAITEDRAIVCGTNGITILGFK